MQEGGAATVKKGICLCRLHNSRTIQLGSCLSCSSSSAICETKGCIKHHIENQRVHNIITVQTVNHVLTEFSNNDKVKKGHLKKMVNEYFMIAKQQIESIIKQVHKAIDNFKFDNIILHEDERKIFELLFHEKFNDVKCSEVASLIPKLIKCSNLQDGHFKHIRNYLFSQKQKLPSILNSVILNLPYFRDYSQNSLGGKFCQVSHQLLRQVNRKLGLLNYRPKKLRLKYVEDEGEQKHSKYILYLGEQLVHLISMSQNLMDLEVFQFYCTWELTGDKYQVAFFQLFLKFPFLNKITVYTGYRIESADFMDDIFAERDVQVRVYRKDWHF